MSKASQSCAGKAKAPKQTYYVLFKFQDHSGLENWELKQQLSSSSATKSLLLSCSKQISSKKNSISEDTHRNWCFQHKGNLTFYFIPLKWKRGIVRKQHPSFFLNREEINLSSLLQEFPSNQPFHRCQTNQRKFQHHSIYQLPQKQALPSLALL